MGQVYLSTYEINTDTSFLPWSEQTIQEGFSVNEAILSTLVNTKGYHLFV